MAGADDTERSAIVEFLSGFEIIHTDAIIMTAASEIRRTSIVERPKTALPDTIILATAVVHASFIVTRNTKDFRYGSVRVPYELTQKNPVQFINIAPPPADASGEGAWEEV